MLRAGVAQNRTNNEFKRRTSPRIASPLLKGQGRSHRCEGFSVPGTVGS
jgi:hypothetical protein